MPNLVGQTLGRYRIVARLGQGGMAEVYKAYHPGLDRFVAIKVMHSHLANDANFVSRFEREARSVYDLRHPNIVQVFDFDSQDGMYYMVMEFIEGPTLKAELEERARVDKPFSLAEIGRLMVTLGEAIDFAHVRGMVHRDLKPANFMLTKAGQIMVLDFGIARIVGATQYTMTGAVTGTPAYMSPEQGQGDRGDERSDIYSLGIILYQMVLGRVPYDADTPFAVILKHINEPLPLPRQISPTVPEDIEKVILKALSKEPADRFQSGSEFADTIQKAFNLSATDNLYRSPILPIYMPLSASEIDPAAPTFQSNRPEPTRVTPETGKPTLAVVDDGPTLAARPQSAAALSRNRWLIVGVIAALLIMGGGGIFLFQGQSRALVSQTAVAQTATADQESAVVLLEPIEIATASATATTDSTETSTPTQTPTTVATTDARSTVAAATTTLKAIAPPATETPTLTDTPAPTATPLPTATLLPTATPLPTAIPAPTATSTILPPTNTPAPVLPTNTPLPPPTPTSSAPLVRGRLAVPVDNGQGGYNIIIYSLPEGQQLGRIENAHQPSFRPDAVKLLVNGEGGGRDNVWEIDGVSYQYEKAVSSSPSDSHPFYSPGGDRLVIGNPNLAVGTDGKTHPYIFVQCGVRNPQEEGDERCQQIATFGILVPNGQIGEVHGSNPIWTGADLIVYKGCNTWEGGNSCGIFQVGSWANKRSSNGVTPTKIPGIDGTDTIPTDAQGNSFLYHDRKNDDWEVYLASINGGPVNLSNAPTATDAMGTFSPDGQWVAFVSNRGGDWAIWAVSASGGTPAKLFDIPWGGSPLRDWQNERLSWGQ